MVVMALVLPNAALAAQGTDGIPANGAVDLLRLAGSLLLVIGAIVCVCWLYARAQSLRVSGRGAITVLASQPVGAKEQVVVVEVADKQLVLGVTSAHVQTLHVFDTPAVSAGQQPLAGAFAERLRSAVRGFTK